MNRPSHHNSFQLLIAHEGFDFKAFEVNDSILTGAQLLSTAGCHPPNEHVIYQWLRNGALESIRPDEVVTLLGLESERFITFRTDRAYRFILNEEQREWGARMVTGSQLKQLARVDSDSNDVFHVIVGTDDVLIEDGASFDLSASGTERIATLPIAIEIFVNTRAHVVNRRTLDYWSVVRLEYPDATQGSETQSYTVTYTKGPKANPAGNLVETQAVQIKKGMEFYVLLTDKS